MCLFWPKEQSVSAKENPGGQSVRPDSSHLLLSEPTAYVIGGLHGQGERTARPIALGGLVCQARPVAPQSLNGSEYLLGWLSWPI